jgi:hypothetical protein
VLGCDVVDDLGEMSFGHLPVGHSGHLHNHPLSQWLHCLNFRNSRIQPA